MSSITLTSEWSMIRSWISMNGLSIWRQLTASTRDALAGLKGMKDQTTLAGERDLFALLDFEPRRRCRSSSRTGTYVSYA